MKKDTTHSRISKTIFSQDSASILKSRDKMLKTAQDWRKFWLWYHGISRLKKSYLIHRFQEMMGREPDESMTSEELVESLFVRYVEMWRLHGFPPNSSDSFPVALLQG